MISRLLSFCPAEFPLNGCFGASASCTRVLLLALTVGLLTGCGDRSGGADLMGKVSGKVTVNGKPLKSGRINFISEQVGVGAGGDLTPEGTYTLDGPVPEGVYKCFITFNIAPSQLGTPAADVVKTVPEKYQSQGTSDLSVTVESGENERDFDLK
jgi:hypothetical protein